MSLTMYDAVTWQNMPGGAQAYAGYVDGYVNWPDVVEAYSGRAHLLSISTQGNYAACLDIENGAATPGMASGWIDRMLAQGVWRPCIYATESTFSGGLYNMIAGYGSKIRRWMAWWDNNPNFIPQGYDGKQYSTNGYDTSVLLDSFFTAGPPPKPPPPADPEHYKMFATGPFNIEPWGNLNERQVVIDYDGAREQWVKYGTYLNHTLRPQLKALAGRVATVAIAQQDHHGQPSWGTYNRGFRFQGLIQRSQGKRFV